MVPEFSRSARGVEVWAALHSLGREGLQDMIERCCRHTRTLATGLQCQGFEVLNDVVLNQVVAKVALKQKCISIRHHVVPWTPKLVSLNPACCVSSRPYQMFAISTTGAIGS